MNRIALVIASAAAACAAAVPAVLGLSGNPSFSQHIPVPVPSKAHLVQFDDSGQAVGDITSSTSSLRYDDRSSGREQEPGDDRGGSSGEPGDDHGGDRTPASSSREPGDDHGGSTSASRGPGGGQGGTSTPRTSAPVSSTSSEPGDDGGHHRGSGSGGSGSGGSGSGGSGSGGPGRAAPGRAVPVGTVDMAATIPGATTADDEHRDHARCGGGRYRAPRRVGAPGPGRLDRPDLGFRAQARAGRCRAPAG